MWREQIKQNNIENQFKGEKMCELFPLEEFWTLNDLLLKVLTKMVLFYSVDVDYFSETVRKHKVNLSLSN